MRAARNRVGLVRAARAPRIIADGVPGKLLVTSPQTLRRPLNEGRENAPASVNHEPEIFSPAMQPGPGMLRVRIGLQGGFMRRSLIATAVGVALAGPVWAGDINQQAGMGDDTLEATSTDTFGDIGNNNSTGDNRNNDGTAGADGNGTAAANNGSTSTA